MVHGDARSRAGWGGSGGRGDGGGNGDIPASNKHIQNVSVIALRISKTIIVVKRIIDYKLYMWTYTTNLIPSLPVQYSYMLQKQSFVPNLGMWLASTV